MEKFIVEKVDGFGNRTYLSSLSKDDLEFSCRLNDAILVSKEQKPLIRKICRKKFISNPTFAKIKDFSSLSNHAVSILHEYDYDYDKIQGGILASSRNEGELGQTLIKEATEDENEIISYKELNEQVANYIIEKYNLKKKAMI
jgi:hypothetical protein